MNIIYYLPTPRTFADVEAWMAGKQSKKAAHNTYVIRCDVAYSVLYHGHEVIRYERDRIIMSHCGWPTSTTWDRFHHLTPFRATLSYNYGGECSGWGRAKERYDRKIIVAGIELPDDGSFITLNWEGERV